MGNDITSKYTEHEFHRKEYTDAILNSTADRKIIISGPGTGKSFLFQEICKKNIEQGKDKNLTLSFINELVDDLKKDLYQLSEVKTLHSFALGCISGDRKIFIKLGRIIEGDYKIATGEKIDFDEVFCNLIEDEDSLSFYSKRRKYYDFFSPNCSVYTLLKIFEEKEEKIPRHSQILIDEFQDFNKLESKLIDFLSRKSPILIVGDDDQSLYDFKYANPNQ
jgi:superfamily II DNA or RNA helicase